MIHLIFLGIFWTLPADFTRDFNGKTVEIWVSVGGDTWIKTDISFQIPAGIRYVRLQTESR